MSLFFLSPATLPNKKYNLFTTKKNITKILQYSFYITFLQEPSSRAEIRLYVPKICTYMYSESKNLHGWFRIWLSWAQTKMTEIFAFYKFHPPILLVQAYVLTIVNTDFCSSSSSSFSISFFYAHCFSPTSGIIRKLKYYLPSYLK